MRDFEQLAKQNFEEDLLALKEPSMSWEEFYNKILNFHILNLTDQEHETIYNFARNGDLFSLKLLIKITGLVPTKTTLGVAVLKGHENIVKFLVQNYNLIPTVYNAGDACRGGYLNLLKYFAKELHVLPDDKGLYFAAYRGHIEVVKFCIEHDILPDQDTINGAVFNNQIEMVKFLLSFDPTLRPSIDIVNIIAANGRKEMLELLKTEFNIVPTKWMGYINY